MNDINEKNVDTSNKNKKKKQNKNKKNKKNPLEDNNVEDNISEDVAENLVNNVTDDANLDNLEEVKLNIDDNEPEMKLKQPNEVYLDIYRAAIKSKTSKSGSSKAYLKKKIKKLYMLMKLNFLRLPMKKK